ncbi:MAG TPA: hypothetical protein VGO88_00760 [Mycetocola sp.]|jgi:hypothetical protein|nr:hypothetical protein [Mycetocola sp.]HEV7847844.1 hypothetical protein [Mycetocola sp.]
MDTSDGVVAEPTETPLPKRRGQPADGIPDGSGSDGHPDSDDDTASGGPAR